MPEIKSPQQAIHLQQNWDLLSKKLVYLQKQYIRETRVEEKFRLEQLITETESERNQVRQELQVLENQNPQDKPEPSLPIWNVPYRQNPYFTGRKELLETLHQKLTTEHTAALTQPQAITGLGGIGKTQTAIEYAYRHRKEYQIIWWLRAEEPATLAADYAQLAVKLNLPEYEATEQTVQIQAVRNWLEQHTGWLLIFDNAEERHDIRHYVPQIGSGQVLITSRNPVWDGLGITLPVEVMQPEEALAFLVKRTNDLDSQAAKILAKTLGYLPLALEQAAAYVRETNSSLNHYQALFQEHHAQLLQHGYLSTEYPDTVATTWKLAFQKVQKASPAAAEFLNLCAFLAPDTIFLNMITEGATYLPKQLAKTVTNPLALDRLISTLLHYALIQREGNTLTIHRLVQSVLRDRLSSTIQRRWAERVMRIVNQAFPVSKFSTWSRCEQLLSHTQIRIDHSALHFNNRLEDAKVLYLWNLGPNPKTLKCKIITTRSDLPPQIYARWIEKWEFASRVTEPLFLNHTNSCNLGSYKDYKVPSSYLYSCSTYSKAKPLFQQALVICKKTLGPDHPDLVITLHNLALLYADQGRYTQAELLYKQALAIKEKALEPKNHPSLATILDNLGRLYTAQGCYTQAEPLYQQALTIKKKTLGPSHPSLATTLDNLANLYADQGNYSEAKSLYQRALVIKKKALGPDHPFLAITLNNFALLYKNQGSYAQAKPLYRQALVIYEKALEPEYLHLATTLNNLANLYYDQGHYTEAEPLHQRALKIYEKTLNPDHPILATTLNNLALLYTEQNRYTDAEPLYQQALAICERTLGPEHPNLVITLKNYAILLHKTERDIEATALETRAHTIQVNILKKSQQILAIMLNDLALLYVKQNHYAKAEPLYQQALEIYEKALGPDHLGLVTTLENYATLLYKTKRDTEATTLETRAQAIRAQHAKKISQQAKELRRLLENKIPDCAG